MSKSDLFAYLAAFVTIILAIAITDLLQSAHRLIVAKDRVKWDLLSPLLALFVLLGIVSDFFGLWDDARFERLTYYGLLAFMVGPIIITMASFAVLPDEVPENGLHLRRFYMERRRYLALLIGMLVAVDVIRAVLLAEAVPQATMFILWRAIPLTLASIIALSVIAVSRAWRAQLAAILTMLVIAHLGYVGWVIDTA